MADLSRLSVNHVTLMEQCSLPAFVDLLDRHAVRAASLWRAKVQEYGVARSRALLEQSGLEVSGYCFGGLISARDARSRAAALDDTRRALDEAAMFGAGCLVFVAGGLDPDDRDISAARARVLEGLAELVPFARQAGVKLALEPLHPMICATRSVLSTLRLANAWCDALGAEDVVGIAVDAYAVWWDPDVESEIARAGRRICAFHVSDWLADTQDLRLDRGMMGDGVIDLPDLRRCVEQAGYDGFVEVEIFSRRNWWRRPADEVMTTVKDRLQCAV